MFTTFHLVPKLNAPNDREVLDVIAEIRSIANTFGVKEIDCVQDITSETLIIAVGGDGTMLEAMRRSACNGGVAFGINMGNTGFLTDCSPNDMFRNVVALLGKSDTVLKDWVITERLVLDTDHISSVACNEIAVSRLYSDSMIKYQLTIGGVNAGTHRANSLVISTPTGSTAYSLSAGGALMMPHMQAIQVVPVAPMTMTSRPFIIPHTSEVVVKVWADDISLRADGQIVKSYQYDFNTKPFVVRVSAHASPAKVIHPRKWNYFSVLTKKLGWIMK